MSLGLGRGGGGAVAGKEESWHISKETDGTSLHQVFAVPLCPGHCSSRPL